MKWYGVFLEVESRKAVTDRQAARVMLLGAWAPGQGARAGDCLPFTAGLMSAAIPGLLSDQLDVSVQTNTDSQTVTLAQLLDGHGF